jgi:ectoine hydroxylase-related dioxygenase (phytanoyl-CoA dioxygenase family)
MIQWRRVRRRAERLVESGSVLAAVDLVQAAVQRRENRQLERLAVRLRHQAFDEVGSSTGAPESWPPAFDVRFADDGRVPEINRSNLDVETLKAGVFGRGSLIVRELFDAEQVRRLREAVRASFRAYDRSDHGESIGRHEQWLHPHALASTPEQRLNDRRWVRKASGVLVADSPRALARLVEAVDGAGVSALLAELFGERPSLSVLKTTLRIVPPGRVVDHGWHQDGAFLGADVRSINMWVALSECGENAPTLQMVPRRLPSVLGSGGAESAFSWSMSTKDVERLCEPEGPQWLHFSPGDVVFFDHLNLHSTAIREGMTEDRLAIEAWFFAPSGFPYDRIPLVV